MARRTSGTRGRKPTPTRRPAPSKPKPRTPIIQKGRRRAPPTPAVVSQPPTPTVVGRQVTEVDQPTTRELHLPEDTSLHEAWRLQQAQARPGATPLSALQATIYGSVLGSTVRGLSESLGLPQILGAMQTPMYGRGGIPYSAGRTYIGDLANKYPGTQVGRWLSGLAEPEQPVTSGTFQKPRMTGHKTQILPYGPPRKLMSRPDLDTGGGGGGGGYSYTPSRYGYGGGGGGVRGQTAARGMGLVNWRIGL